VPSVSGGKSSQKPTAATVKSAVDQLGEDLTRLAADIDKMRRIQRGIPRANAEIARTNKRVEALDGRTSKLEARADNLEYGQNKMVENHQSLMGIVRTQAEDSAMHEQRISGLETKTEKLARSESVGPAWLASVVAVEAFIFIAWLAMKNFNGGNGKLGNSPSYDSLFVWIAAGSFVVISLVAIVISAARSTGSSSAPTAARQPEAAVKAVAAEQGEKPDSPMTFTQLYATQTDKAEELLAQKPSA